MNMAPELGASNNKPCLNKSLASKAQAGTLKRSKLKADDLEESLQSTGTSDF